MCKLGKDFITTEDFIKTEYDDYLVIKLKWKLSNF